MKTDSRCSSCGTEIDRGTGHYSTPHGLYCLACGVRLPIPPTARVTVTVTDPEQLLDGTTKRAL